MISVGRLACKMNKGENGGKTVLDYTFLFTFSGLPSEKLPYLSLDRRNEEATRFLSIIDILAVSLSSLAPFVPLGLMV